MAKLGDIRASQLIYTFGVGSVLDLPNLSALVMGLDDWDTRRCTEIVEDRLIAALRRDVGAQLRQLYLPPVQFDSGRVDIGGAPHGVPVAPFPRWLRCPLCDTLATIDSGVFRLVPDPWRPDRTQFVHEGCTKGRRPPRAFPVRFLLACREGHLTDFPWVKFVHGNGSPCRPARLTLREFGASGDASDIRVRCLECDATRSMGQAFDRDWQPVCPAHHPHLRTFAKDGCEEIAKTILLGASNSWFPVSLSVLSIPQAVDKLPALVDENWAALKDIESKDVLKYATHPSRMPQFVDYSADDIWEAIEARRNAATATGALDDHDIKLPEWNAFSAAEPAPRTRDFQLRKVGPPVGFEQFFEESILVERLREVRALLGFTRIESNGDFADALGTAELRRAPITRGDPLWLPASEVRGEGLFLRLKEDVLSKWERRAAVREVEQKFRDAHAVWRRARNILPEHDGFPGMRYILLHSLAHALMRQIVLDCGYTAASVRERIYCRGDHQEGGPMAGILLYTAASDSEGTLGGLVEQGDPMSLGRHMQQALESLKICASDPLCSENEPTGDGRGIHAASCHACLFAPETSCERGNRYLDRAAIVSTFARSETALLSP